MSQVPAPPPPASLPRWSLAGLSLVHALIFAWAANTLPWQRWTVFAATTAIVAASHAVTAVLAAAGSSWRRTAWRLTSFFALTYLAIQTWTAVRAGVYIAVLYGGLGTGVAAGLATIWGVLVLLTAPLAVWGISVTGGLPRWRSVGLAGALIAAFGLGSWQAATATAATAVPRPSGTSKDLATALQAELDARGLAVPRGKSPVSLWTRAAIQCDEPLDRPTAIVSYPVFDPKQPAKGRRPAGLRGTSRCVQADTPDALLPAVRAVTADAAAPGPMKIDIITATQALDDANPGPVSLLLRPGLDGVCAGKRCLMPWQLVALGQFNTYTPLPFIEDLRFGSDVPALRRAFARRGDPEDAEPTQLTGLTRISSESFIVDRKGQVVPAPAMRAELADVGTTELARAAGLAERHVLAAQADDGRFRYILQPFTGRVTWRGFALPRQAGTTLTLCELGSSSVKVQTAAAKSLAMMASLERRVGELSGLVYAEKNRPIRPVAGLGDTALPLIAFLTCRPRVGPDHDALIGRLARFLLAMQRPDGGFHPRYHLGPDATSPPPPPDAAADPDAAPPEPLPIDPNLPPAPAPIPGPDPMYAAGQVVFALVLLEALLSTDDPPEGLPSLAEVHVAVERAMQYFASEYWGHGLYNFFFLEENWHCLAARAALPVHRHAGYEQFCLDYVDFKRRLILAPETRPDLDGAYGFGQVLPPHNTPTGGFGETLAAAMAIREVQDTARPEDHTLMRRVLRFLVAQQWTDANCFACTTKHTVVGGYSESLASPDMRIDYTQHVWSALGHGKKFVAAPEAGDGT